MRTVVAISFAAMAALGCRQGDAAKPKASSAESHSAVNSSAVAPAPRAAKVVFIDKAEACDCTRKRIDASWAALQAAFTAGSPLPVDRIHVDTEAAKAEPFTALKPMMVPPGLYFVDAQGGVLEMLQGEITTDQIARVLR